MSEAAQRPSRRSVLAAAGAGLLAVTGCVPGNEPAQPPVDPEVRTRARIADEVRALSRTYAAVGAAFPDAAPQLDAFAAEHDAHARALTGPTRSSTSTSSPSAPPSPVLPDPEVPTARDAAIRSLIVAEEAAARRRSAQAGRASPALARLLASIAGSEAAHAALLQGPVGATAVGPG